jgi:hypothetical protein
MTIMSKEANLRGKLQVLKMHVGANVPMCPFTISASLSIQKE